MTLSLHTPLRPVLLAAGRSPRMKSAVTRVPATRSVVNRFVAGETEGDAVDAAAAILASDRYISIDHLGEDVTDRAQADDNVAHYRRLLTGLHDQPSDDHRTGATSPIEVSLKLSALGQLLTHDGHRIAVDNAATICAAAADAGAMVTVDAEDHTTTDSTLAIVRELRRDFPTVGTVLQAYLRRTESDCHDFADAGSRIRLCKGAYREPSTVAFHGRGEVDDSYRRCLAILMAGDGYPMVATHDPAMITAAMTDADAAARSADDFEIQMLYGIRDDEQRRLATDGTRVRVYLPYGQQWYGYFMRRLAERPANLTFFLRSMATTG